MSIERDTDSLSERQEIFISDRRILTLTGVLEVESFDDTSIILKSNLGMIAIDGEELRISTLSRDEGRLIVEGTIGGVVFFEPMDPSGKGRRGKVKGTNGVLREKSRGFFG